MVLHIPPGVDATSICQAILAVTRKGVRTLINNHRRDSVGQLVQAQALPSTVFLNNNARLTHFILEYWEILILPPTFNGFPNLIRLDLIPCDIESVNLLERLISGCPELRYMLLTTASKLGELTINASKLEVLIVLSSSPFQLFLGDDTNSITTLRLDGPTRNNLRLIISRLPYVHTLGLGSLSWLHSDHGPSKEEGLIDNLRRLETLVIFDISIQQLLAFVLTLPTLNNPPPLRTLYCRVSRRGLSGYDDDHLLNFDNVNLPRLKIVEIVCVSGSSLEIQFIKAILARAPVLEVMKIELGKEVKGAKEKLKITKKIMQFP